MLPVVISSSLHLARTPEAVIPAVGVLNTWALAAIAAPVVLSTTVGIFRSRAENKAVQDTELKALLKDFTQGR